MTTERKPSFNVTNEGGEESTALDNLANELERERDARKEERFLLILAFIVLADAYIFSHMESWSGPLVIGVIELVGLAVLARKWGVQEVSQFLAMFFQRMADHSSPPAANTPPTGEIPPRP